MSPQLQTDNIPLLVQGIAINTAFRYHLFAFQHAGGTEEKRRGGQQVSLPNMEGPTGRISCVNSVCSKRTTTSLKRPPPSNAPLQNSTKALLPDSSFESFSKRKCMLCPIVCRLDARELQAQFKLYCSFLLRSPSQQLSIGGKRHHYSGVGMISKLSTADREIRACRFLPCLPKMMHGYSRWTIPQILEQRTTHRTPRMVMEFPPPWTIIRHT